MVNLHLSKCHNITESNHNMPEGKMVTILAQMAKEDLFLKPILVEVGIKELHKKSCCGL